MSPKKIGLFSLIMLNVIAINNIRGLPICATFGYSIITFYILGSLLFFIPCIMAALFLAKKYPDSGGIYLWVKNAFGKEAGILVAWLQWLYNITSFPAVLSFLVMTIDSLSGGYLSRHTMLFTFSMIILFWIITGLNFFPLTNTTFITTAGAIIGTLLPMALLIFLSYFYFLHGGKAEINWSFHNLLPTTSFNNISFITMVIFSLMGIEMSAIHANDISNPQKTIPRAMIIAGLIVVISLVIASLSVAVIVPYNQLSIVNGIMQAFAVVFAHFHLQWLLPIVVVCIVFGTFSGVSAWVAGPSKCLAIALSTNSKVALIKKKNREIVIAQSIIVTVICFLLLACQSIKSYYWIFTALTTEFSLVVYCLMFLSAIKLYFNEKINQKYAFINITSYCVGLIVSAAMTIFAMLPPSFILPSYRSLYVLFMALPVCLILLLILIKLKQSTNLNNPSGRDFDFMPINKS